MSASVLDQDWVQPVREAAGRIAAQHVYLVGSAVTKGAAARDVDLIVVADCFHGVPYPERKSMLALPPGLPFDALLLSSRELEHRRSDFLQLQTALNGREVQLWP